MTEIRKVYKIGPGLCRHGVRPGTPGASVAAPFDMPSAIFITLGSDEATAGMVLEFKYDFGHDEPITEASEKLAGTLVWFGRVSGRVMRIQIPRHQVNDILIGAAEELKLRRSRMPAKPGTPLRQAAHYDFVGTLLPGLDAFIAEQLPQLRLTP